MGLEAGVLIASMLSARPRSRSRVACSTPSSPTTSEDEQPLSSSTYSLLSPIYHQSFQSCNEEEEEDREEAAPSARGKRTFKRNKHNSAESCNVTEKKKQSPPTDNLSPWEEWFICKEKELRVRLQARALEEMNLQLEKRKEKQELERKKKIAEEKHKEWVQQKNEEERREKERKLIKKMAEKAVRDLERIQLQEKAKGKYKEWLKKKRAEESEKKKKEEEKEQKRVAELQEKKEKSEKIFREWLQHARNKPRPVLHSYGYTNGKLSGYPDGNSYPAPAYCNPIPWKPIHVPPPKEDKNVTVKKSKRPISSQSYRSSSMVIHKPKNNLCIGSLHRKQR
ncbi:coiled-coil domain-containing protein 34 isoform X1 [Chelonia mydas]|uniref:coiled-coil domain-containing protein 34 isoform X1 n=2 Tax=Chelonia mydas TaxID=8469 RepID=UPI0018A23A43|nr:coiled-coil domain-containing protein 34 isoform X1 [Chelonia mydas]